MAGSGKRDRTIDVSISAVLATLECVVELGDKLDPSLDARVVVPHFADALQCLVIRQHAGLCVPKVASKSFDRPVNVVAPGPLGIEGRAADTRNDPHSAVRLLLL